MPLPTLSAKDTVQDANPYRGIRLRRDQVFQDLIAVMQVVVGETKPLNLLQRSLQVWAEQDLGPATS